MLDAIGLPTTLSGLSRLVVVRGGRVLSRSELARLRRRDERQFAAAHTRPRGWRRPSATPGSWPWGGPLEQRILGSRTARTSHLRLLLTLLDSLDDLSVVEAADMLECFAHLVPIEPALAWRIAEAEHETQNGRHGWLQALGPASAGWRP